MTTFPTRFMTGLGRAASVLLAYALGIAIVAALILPRLVAPLPVQALRPPPDPVVARTPPPFQTFREPRP